MSQTTMGPKGGHRPNTAIAGGAIVRGTAVKRGADLNTLVQGTAASVNLRASRSTTSRHVGRTFPFVDQPGEIVEVRAGAAFALDALLTSDANGKLITAATTAPSSRTRCRPRPRRPARAGASRSARHSRTVIAGRVAQNRSFIALTRQRETQSMTMRQLASDRVTRAYTPVFCRTCRSGSRTGSSSPTASRRASPSTRSRACTASSARTAT
jgi:hypothetical protein